MHCNGCYVDIVILSAGHGAEEGDHGEDHGEDHGDNHEDDHGDDHGDDHDEEGNMIWDLPLFIQGGQTVAEGRQITFNQSFLWMYISF